MLEYQMYCKDQMQESMLRHSFKVWQPIQTIKLWVNFLKKTWRNGKNYLKNQLLHQKVGLNKRLILVVERVDQLWVLDSKQKLQQAEIDQLLDLLKHKKLCILHKDMPLEDKNFYDSLKEFLLTTKL